MNRFWSKILLLLPLPLLVIGYNWFVDPVHLRGQHEYESGIARLVLAGNHVTNISNPNDAAFVSFVANGLRQRRDVLVFGSSRSKLIREDSFPGLTLFNNSVNGGGLADYLAIYELYRAKGLTPSFAVIELSPWILGGAYHSIWDSLNAQAQTVEERLLSTSSARTSVVSSTNANRPKPAEFLSLGYFQTSFYTWLDHRFHGSSEDQNYSPWNGETLAMGETLLSDGSMILSERAQGSKANERVLAVANEFGHNPVAIPESLDPGREQVLEAFLDKLLRDNVRPILFLPPYHPRAYALMTKSTRNRIIVDEQAYFEALARRKGLAVVGSYNPADLSLDETAFFDGSHPTADAVHEMFVSHVPQLATKASSATRTSERVELMGVSNLNGVETVDGKPFFWVGDGDSCLTLRCGRNGVVQLIFRALPGPSLPQTPERSLLLLASDGFSKRIHISDRQDITIQLPVRTGLNRVYLSATDKPTVSTLSNGDSRPLLVGMTDVSVKLLPQDTVLARETFEASLPVTSHLETNAAPLTANDQDHASSP